MNSPPIKPAVSQRAPDQDTYLDWLQRTAHPVLVALRKLGNDLSQNEVETVSATGTIGLQSDLVLVDASAGPVTLTPPTAALWERRIVVIKTDASANAVTVVAVNTATLSAQYDACELICDGALYYFTATTFSLPPPEQFKVLGSADGLVWSPRFEGQPVASGMLTYPPAGNNDLLVFTVPASPTGLGRFMLQRAYARAREVLVGAGSIAVRIGTSAGDNSIGTDQTVTSATAVGTIFSGQAIASRGSVVLVANSYEAALAAGATIYARATATGAVTGGSCEINVYGAFLP